MTDKPTLHLGISARILAFVIPIVLLTIIIISSVGYYNARTIIGSQQNSEILANLGEAGNRIDILLKKEKAMAQSLAASIGTSWEDCTEKGLEALLLNYAALYTETTGMGLWFAPGVFRGIHKYAPYVFRSGEKIVYSDEYTTGDFDIWESEWYQIGSAGEGGWTGVYKDVVSGSPMVTIAVPIYKGSTFLGVVTVDVDISEISKIVEQLREEYKGEIVLLQSNGAYIAGQKGENELGSLEWESEPKEFGGLIRDHRLAETVEAKVEQYNSYVAFSYPIEETSWAIIFGIHANGEESAILMRLKYVFVLTGLASMAIIVIISLYIAGNWGKIARRYVDFSASIAKGALNNRLEEKDQGRGDEFGEIGRSLSAMQAHLRRIIQGLAEDSRKVSSHARSLSVFSQQMSHAAENTATSVSKVAADTNSQFMTLKEISDSVHLFGEQINKLDKTMEILDQSAESIGILASQSDSGMNQMTDAFDKINSNIAGLLTKVRSVESSVQRVGEITELINSISRQTNLLALNASIEASRAGEAGKSFAVVAEEIRKLAERSKSEVGEISDIIAEIFEDTLETVSFADNVNKELCTQKQNIDKSIVSFKKIISAVGEVRPRIRNAGQNARLLNEEKNALMDRVRVADEISENIKESADNILTASEESMSMSQELAASAADLKSLTDKMEEKVELFTL